MQQVRRSEDRGHAEHGWLSSRHTFSFADYVDPEHMGFGPLRVINEDRVQAGQGFGTHGHQDMEIVSYVLAGALEHKDSLGTGSVLRPGDVQRMSAGTGVRHSEFNHSAAEPVHFLQIWIVPARRGVAPSYEEKHFDAASKRGQLRLIVSPDGRDGSLSVHQDARIFASLMTRDDRIEFPIESGRRAYLHVARGQLTVNGVVLNAGDAMAVQDESQVTMERADGAEFLLFDLSAGSGGGGLS